jgi:hypothetical protein
VDLTSRYLASRVAVTFEARDRDEHTADLGLEPRESSGRRPRHGRAPRRAANTTEKCGSPVDSILALAPRDARDGASRTFGSSNDDEAPRLAASTDERRQQLAPPRWASTLGLRGSFLRVALDLAIFVRVAPAQGLEQDGFRASMRPRGRPFLGPRFGPAQASRPQSDAHPRAPPERSRSARGPRALSCLAPRCRSYADASPSSRRSRSLRQPGRLRRPRDPAVRSRSDVRTERSQAHSANTGAPRGEMSLRFRCCSRSRSCANAFGFGFRREGAADRRDDGPPPGSARHPRVCSR